jgi:hypothetical protein
MTRLFGTSGCLAQLVRATRLHRVGRGFESLSIHQGPLAQLVERFHGMEEVSGSSPLRSTKNDCPSGRSFLFATMMRV